MSRYEPNPNPLPAGVRLLTEEERRRRDMFAAAALTGILAHSGIEYQGTRLHGKGGEPEMAAHLAMRLMDELDRKERSYRQEPLQ